MMRLALLADIHGNLPALQAVMRDMAGQQVDQAVVAGDLINWGPFSAEVLEEVSRAGWAVIRGNNELYLTEYRTSRQPPHWESFTLLPWLEELVGEGWRARIALWPDELTLRFADAPAVRVFHGLPGDPWRGLHPLLGDGEIADLLRGVAEPVVVGAHTHLPQSRRSGAHHLLNPGSVGVPLDGQLRASYMILDGDALGWRATLRQVEYDLAPLLAEFAAQRFEERCGPIAPLVVREFRTARLWVLPYLRWKQEHAPGQADTAELVEVFLAQDVWQHTPPEYHLNR